MNNYTSSIEEAAKKANIKFDEVYTNTKTKDRILIIYGNKENEEFSVGLLKKNWLGYQWIMGSGIGENSKGRISPVTIAMANLPMENHGMSNDFVSVAYGSVVSDQIAKLNVRFGDKDIKAATIIDTSMGRRWYIVSDNPIQKDPQVIALNKEDKEIYRNY